MDRSRKGCYKERDGKSQRSPEKWTPETKEQPGQMRSRLGAQGFMRFWFLSLMLWDHFLVSLYFKILICIFLITRK